ncbi:MAG: response regulator [Myxococcaceae bacterium]
MMVTPLNPQVLIVDDDAFVRVFLKDALEGGNYRFLEAADGEEAVEKAQASQPDVVLLDLFMPKQSGLEALSRLRQVTPDSRVVVISSLDSESLVQQALEAGALGFISKPFHPMEIVSAVRQALAGSVEQRS